MIVVVLNCAPGRWAGILAVRWVWDRPCPAAQSPPGPWSHWGAPPGCTGTPVGKREETSWRNVDLIMIFRDFCGLTNRFCHKWAHDMLLTWNQLQGRAKEWALGCVNSPPAARGSQEAGFTQPRANSFAKPFIFEIMRRNVFLCICRSASAPQEKDNVILESNLQKEVRYFKKSTVQK